MIKVVAKQEGVYGGYNREEGEVFEVDDKPYEVKGENGKPVPDVDEHGKPRLGPGGKPKMKMATMFAPEWMERVPDDTEVTNDYPPYQIPKEYRPVKAKHPVTQTPTEKPLPSSVI